MRDALTRLRTAVVSRPIQVLAIATLLTLAALTSLVDVKTLTPRFDVDPSMSSLMPRDGAALATLERTQRLFPQDDVLLVAWTGDGVFTPAGLAGLKQLTRTIEALPDVITVDSLATAQDLRVTAEATYTDAFLREVPTDIRTAQALRERALANPLLRGRLLATDGSGTLVVVQFTPGLATATLLDRLDKIRAASAAAAVAGIQQFVSGPILVRLEISRILRHDLLLIMPLAVCATLLVAALGFRSWRGTVLPMFGNVAAVFVVLAMFVDAGHTLNFVTVILPPVVYVVGFAYAIHVVAEFDRRYRAGVSREDAVAATLREVFMPLTLTALTTAIAFAALATSAIDSIQVFGLYTALGVGLAWLGALTVIPAGLMLLPASPVASDETGANDRLAAWLAGITIRHRTLLLTLGGGLALVSASRITVDTEVLRNFADDSPIQRNFRDIAARYAGPVPLHIVLEAGTIEGLKSPEYLAAIAKFAAWLKAQPEIGGVYALSDYIAMLNQALAPDMAVRAALPADARSVDHLLLIAGNEDQHALVDRSFTTTLIQVHANTLSTAAVNRLAARIKTELATLPPGLRGELTGTSYLIARSVDAITVGQVTSLAIAFGAIFIVLSLLFGSARVGLLTLIPNMLPIVGYFGLLGASGITLNLTTSLVACAVFGIAIDDTVHLMSRYAQETARHADRSLRMRAALSGVLRPVSLTSFALAAGFAALTQGELHSQAEFGLLAAGTLLFAWLVDISFTPALLSRADIRPIWQRQRQGNAASI